MCVCVCVCVCVRACVRVCMRVNECVYASFLCKWYMRERIIAYGHIDGMIGYFICSSLREHYILEVISRGVGRRVCTHALLTQNIRHNERPNNTMLWYATFGQQLSYSISHLSLYTDDDCKTPYKEIRFQRSICNFTLIFVKGWSKANRRVQVGYFKIIVHQGAHNFDKITKNHTIQLIKVHSRSLFQ